MCASIKKIILCTKSGSYSGVTFSDPSLYVGSIGTSSGNSFKHDDATYMEYRTSGTYIGRYDDYDYMYNSDGAILLKSSKDWSTDSVISLPASIDGYPIFGIEIVIRENKSVTRIDLPPTVESLPDYFGYKCKALVSVTGTSKIKQIGRYSFSEAVSLVDFDFSSLETIGYDCFNNTKLKTLIAPNLKKTDQYCFSGCTEIEYVYLPKITKLVKGVINGITFGDWTKLKAGVIGSKNYPVTEVYSYKGGGTSSSMPFYYNENLQHVVIVTNKNNKQNLPVNNGANIGNGITHNGVVSSRVFGLDDRLNAVTTSLVDARLYIDDNYVAIIMDEADEAIICEDKTIQDNTTYNIPSKIDGVTVTSLAPLSYAVKSKLVTLTVPDTVVKIGYATFFNNTAMTTLRGCKGIKKIPDYAIYNNVYKRSISTIGEVDNEINLPSVEAIYAYGLTYCKPTGDVNIPKLAYLGENALNGNNIGGDVILGGNIYITSSNIFNNAKVGGIVTFGSNATPITDTSSWSTSMFNTASSFSLTIYMSSGTTATGAPWGGTHLTINYINV